MAVLSCGDGGSTGQEVIGQVNDNTEDIGINEVAIVAVNDAQAVQDVKIADNAASIVAIGTGQGEQDLAIAVNSIDIVDLQAGQVAQDAVTLGNTNGIAALETSQTTQDSSIAANAAALVVIQDEQTVQDVYIQENKDDIAALQSVSLAQAAELATDAVDIEDLQDRAPFIPTFDYLQDSGLTVTGDTNYHQITRLITPVRVSGTYVIHSQVDWTLNVDNKPAVFRISIDGGTNWKEFETELADKDNLHTANHFDIIVTATADIIDVIIEAKVTDSANVLTIFSTIVTAQRKL